MHFAVGSSKIVKTHFDIPSLKYLRIYSVVYPHDLQAFMHPNLIYIYISYIWVLNWKIISSATYCNIGTSLSLMPARVELDLGGQWRSYAINGTPTNIPVRFYQLTSFPATSKTHLHNFEIPTGARNFKDTGHGSQQLAPPIFSTPKTCLQLGRTGPASPPRREVLARPPLPCWKLLGPAVECARIGGKKNQPGAWKMEIEELAFHSQTDKLSTFSLWIERERGIETPMNITLI